MNPLKKRSITALTKAAEAAENKRKGITGDAERIRERLRAITDAVEHPVPNRVIDDE